MKIRNIRFVGVSPFSQMFPLVGFPVFVVFNPVDVFPSLQFSNLVDVLAIFRCFSCPFVSPTSFFCFPAPLFLSPPPCLVSTSLLFFANVATFQRCPKPRNDWIIAQSFMNSLISRRFPTPLFFYPTTLFVSAFLFLFSSFLKCLQCCSFLLQIAKTFGQWYRVAFWGVGEIHSENQQIAGLLCLYPSQG